MAKKGGFSVVNVQEALFNKELDNFYTKIAKDEHQLFYYETIMSKNTRIVMVDEPSGTGKTSIAFKAGLDLLKRGLVSKIVYIRFPSKRGEGLGFTTGDLKEKQAKYMKPAIQCLVNLGIMPEVIEEMLIKGQLEFVTDAEERGMTRDDEFAIIDESQNAIDIEQLNLVLTRFTDNSKVLLIGHSKQRDNKNVLYSPHKLNAFQLYQYHYMKKSWATKCSLVKNYRGELSRWSDEVYSSLTELNTLEPLPYLYSIK